MLLLFRLVSFNCCCVVVVVCCIHHVCVNSDVKDRKRVSKNKTGCQVINSVVKCVGGHYVR